MASNFAENGVDGDDEREEEEDEADDSEDGEEEEDEDEEEEEEEEPRLKYQRMQGDMQTLLEKDAASCIVVADRAIGLGTHSGKVYILDFLGNKIKGFAAHTSVVNDLCFELEGEYIGSCSDDGTVVINSLFTDEVLKFTYRRAMKTIALDPEYERKSSKRFVTGGVAGDLYLNVKKWIGYRDQLLHSGEGPIHAVKWRGNLIAWANKVGVKVYDAANNQRITFIEKPRGSPPLEVLQAHLVWQVSEKMIYLWDNVLLWQVLVPLKYSTQVIDNFIWCYNLQIVPNHSLKEMVLDERSMLTTAAEPRISFRESPNCSHHLVAGGGFLCLGERGEKAERMVGGRADMKVHK